MTKIRLYLDEDTMDNDPFFNRILFIPPRESLEFVQELRFEMSN